MPVHRPESGKRRGCNGPQSIGHGSFKRHPGSYGKELRIKSLPAGKRGGAYSIAEHFVSCRTELFTIQHFMQGKYIHPARVKDRLVFVRAFYVSAARTALE
jgi:hypothetical protein